MHTIEHVSDTALMVAACRALENDRPDGLIRDPFAAALAGEKGLAIARASSAVHWMCFGIGLRTHFIDAFIERVIEARGIRRIVNIGAVLDTRPWRMNLPADLRWLEVDFEPVLAHKEERLAGASPSCIVERMAADISTESGRRSVFEAVGPEPALMLTEGLLMYLPRAAVSAIATESAARSGIRNWIFDVSALALMRAAHGDTMDAIQSVRAEDHLEGAEVLDAVTAHNWRVADSRTYVRDSRSVPAALERILRITAAAGPQPERAPDNDPSGIYLLEHLS